MRPRSRLPSKRTPLLPTIREGAEDAQLKDTNDNNNTYSSSEDDYFLSICHLAHPTFPARDFASHYAQDSRLGCYGHADPLEHLYGQHAGAQPRYGRKHANERKRAHSIPNTSKHPDPTPQRKSSCPELRNGRLPKTDIAAVMEEEEEVEETEEEEGGRRQGPGSIKPSLISQWISDCRSAWREARARACLLPAIAEI